jgi:hypothetical protein
MLLEQYNLEPEHRRACGGRQAGRASPNDTQVSLQGADISHQAGTFFAKIFL